MYVQEKIAGIDAGDHYIVHNDLFIKDAGESSGRNVIAKGKYDLFVGTKEEVEAKKAELNLPEQQEFIDQKLAEQQNKEV